LKLGDNLRDLLEQHDMTQKQFAQELDITPAAMGNYIRNIREPDYGTLVKMARYFRVSTDYLLCNQTENGLSHDEEFILTIYRTLTPEQKEIYLEQGKVFIKQNNKKNSSTSGSLPRTKKDVGL